MSEEGVFAGPVSWMGLDPENTVEIEISGPAATHLAAELDAELRQVDGLEVCQYIRKAFDIPQLVYFAGAVGGILQGLDILYHWYVTKHTKGEGVTIVIRTKRSGEIELDPKEARRLFRQLKDLLNK